MSFLDKLKRKKDEGYNPLDEATQSDNQIEETEHTTMYDKVQDVEVEAAIPQNMEVGKQSNIRKVGFAAIGLVAVGIIVAGIMSFVGGSSDETADSGQPQVIEVQNSQQKDFDKDKEVLAQLTEEETSLMASDAVSEVPPPESSVPVSDGNTQQAPTTNGQAPTEAEVTPKERKLTGSVLAFAGSGSESSNSSNESGEAVAVANQNDSGAFSDRLKPSVMASATASKRGDTTFLLRKGTNIPCTLDTQIITTYAGLTRCIVNKDVYSANGKVLLIERGSMVNGEQTTALLQGQARVFVLWSDVETPKGVKVSLNSPSSGQLGASGQSAHVKYHFFRRFGGAILISLIGDLGEAYSSRQGNKGSDQSFTFENTSEGAQEMATEALKNSINIPPTAFINQGQLLNIMVARDVDFAKVYDLVDIKTMY